jgi:hypothetical protein
MQQHIQDFGSFTLTNGLLHIQAEQEGEKGIGPKLTPSLPWRQVSVERQRTTRSKRLAGSGRGVAQRQPTGWRARVVAGYARGQSGRVVRQWLDTQRGGGAEDAGGDNFALQTQAATPRCCGPRSVTTERMAPRPVAGMTSGRS